MEAQPSYERRGHSGGAWLAVLLLLMVAVPAVAPSAHASAVSEDYRVVSEGTKKAGALAVLVHPLLPEGQRVGYVLRGERVTLEASLLKGIRGTPSLQRKAERGWKPLKRVEVHTYPRDGLGHFSFRPRAGEQRLRVVWNRRGKTRATNSVKVNSRGRWQRTRIVDGIAADPRTVRISGDGSAFLYSGPNFGALFAADRTGAVDMIAAAGAQGRSISSNGRFVFYDTVVFDDAQPMAATKTSHVFDRVLRTETELATWKLYDKAGTQTEFLRASDDGQHALLQRSVDGQLDALIVRALPTGEQTTVYEPTAEELAADLKLGPVSLSDDGSTVAFEVGPPKSLSVQLWRRSTGQAVAVAASTGAHVWSGPRGLGTSDPVLQLSNDATRLLYDDRRSLQVLDVTTGVSSQLPVRLVLGSTPVIELAGNGAAVWLQSGAATGIYQLDTGRWVSLENSSAPSIADDGRTVASTNGPLGSVNGLQLWVAPWS